MNLSVRVGFRNDIEIYRCRGLIDQTPVYQRYLAQVNRLRGKYCDPLLLGLYRDTDGIASDNPTVKVGSFANDGRLAVVATQSAANTATTHIRVPGYAFKESDVVGDASVDTTAADGKIVRLGKDGLAILLFEKE